jgi:hypothetical protein
MPQIIVDRFKKYIACTTKRRASWARGARSCAANIATG